ncbi:WD repeat-containing protein 76-like isoform X2 [Ostrea edulis]|uniref:WD repeat-containing protein 76-like isoform X2 n=1 Tax=Ostrea edulis TaxID=37623 RepID=UPI0024AEA860|nr:WD repeat-containing protein 76-like isoform X2 [Ostrea edulis]
MPITLRSRMKRRLSDSEGVQDQKRKKIGLTAIKTEPKQPLTALPLNIPVVSTATDMERLQPAIKKLEMSKSAITKLEKSQPAITKLEKSQKEEDLSSEDDDDPDFEEELDFETRRQRNIQDNADIFSRLGFHEAKVELKISSKTYKPKPASKRMKIPKPALAPSRRSQRLQRIDPEGQPLPALPVVEPVVYEHARKPPGPINMVDTLFTGNPVEDHENLLMSLDNVTVSLDRENNSPLTRFVKDLHKLRLDGDRVSKVVPDRIFSLSVHPSENQTLVIAGDKWGKLGFWDVVHEKSDSDGIVVYHPHSRPINEIRVSPYNHLQVVSSSYDGTSRCCDLQKAVFDEIYATCEDDDNLLKNFDFLSADTIVYSQQDGTVAVVDKRSPGTQAEHVYALHPKSLRTVSVHPIKSHLIVTSSTDCTAKLWDLRNLKAGGKSNKWLDSIGHSKNVYSAYFSPVSGKYILTTSLDGTLNIVECSESGGLGKRKVIRHNNHVGRWLTPFRAAWHPAREDVFVVGSMERPRQIQVFDCEGKVLRNLTDLDYLGSVCSLNAFHPTRNILVGGNSSGRVHVFMQQVSA